MSVRPVPSIQHLLRLRAPNAAAVIGRRHASGKPITNKARILEKPERFNPPSHGSRRRHRPRSYGPSLTGEEFDAQQKKKYPNMMPPEGTVMHKILTSRGLHLWITLSTLTILAVSTVFMNFLHETEFRDQLPYGSDVLWHPFQSLSQFLVVYKLHTQHESEKVAEKRRKKLEDAQKRKEFMKAHGVEPGFLTGSWMDKFGTIEGDAEKARALAAQQEAEQNTDVQSPVAPAVEDQEAQAQPREKKKPKYWLGIW